jgi:hypothetical protein
LEQPDILDSDDRLISKGLKQLDLRRGKGPQLGAPCVQGSNYLPMLTKWNE